MKYTYPKDEKLKSRIVIEDLFSKGNSVSKYPLRLVYISLDQDVNKDFNGKIKMGISVSKKYFKHAVDRNYFKRVLRETYRLNKHIILDKIETPMAFMFFYQTKERLSYQEIDDKTKELFEKFISVLSSSSNGNVKL
jgi:ribonuclease P protein component